MNNPFNNLNSEDLIQIGERFHEIRDRVQFFQLLHDTVDFLDIPNKAKKGFHTRLNIFANHPRGNYRTFTIKKASGKDRVIHSPDDTLKLMQRLINIILSSVFTSHSNTFGYIKGKNIVDNAKLHIRQHYVYNLDLENFFDSIDHKRIICALREIPFSLSSEREKLAFFITNISTMVKEVVLYGPERRNALLRVLPQGAPSSPVLSNIVCAKLDISLNGLAQRFGLNYSRYADDITFSSHKNLFKTDSAFNSELRAIIAQNRFNINESKTRMQRSSSRQEVTGLTVNEKINVSQRFIKTLRMYLFYWERYGYDKAESIYFRDECVNTIYPGTKSLLETVHGRMNFLKFVKGESEPMYQKLERRFIKLASPKGKIKKVILQRSDEYFSLHKPKDVATFLRLFQDSDGLKYLTHDYDIPGREYQYANIIDLAKKDLNTAYKKYFITKALYARIMQFAFTSEPEWWRWSNGSMKRLYTGWSSLEIKEWALQNPGVHPIRVKTFRDEFIRPFKDSIQIRAPRLRNLMEETIREKFLEDVDRLTITYTNLEQAAFYTDVDIILGGIRHLLDGIHERMEVSLEISISFEKQYVNGNLMKLIKISHHNSICYLDASIDELLKGNFIDARKEFLGLCNWSVSANFANGAKKIYLLKDDEELPDIEDLDENNIIGFTHTLYFY